MISRKPVSGVVASCLSAGCFDLQAGERLLPEIRPFVVGTRFQGKINVDYAPLAGMLNFYVATRKLPGQLGTISCNCAYVGADIVICDKAFLETFSSSVNFTQDSFYGEGSREIWTNQADLFERVNQITSSILRTWIIGHEIGHAVLHAPTSSERRIAMTKAKENAADSFFLEKASVGHDEKAVRNLHWGLNQLIMQIIVITFKDGKAHVAPSSDDIHEPWILRAIALGQELTDRGPEPENDYYKSLSRDISVEPGGGSIGSLCQFQNLRERATQIQKKRLGEH
ncbi:hypothetical protein RFM68_23310 [Mesorhizobium sp. MSK_1335]|uniref:IrrE N-terminal-like domain-containing protein n=1 Tax=Mesorhizobium montanum TaxID=3072323 RepID=A0ABU4ZPW1_9HYPH|nr:hypothetical protein [Mesorhizobium sp. MSK_1335]MDX8527433.1 hypothetical protein [Mesorhizobium sp. MSK_1335]